MTRNVMLVVDDKEVNRYMLCEIFKDKYTLLEAEDGIEAIEMLKQHKDRIAVVLLDIIMPNMSGFGVLDYMTSNKLLTETPVVMITSDASAITEKKLEQYDVAEVVRKPFIPAIVSRRVNNIVALYEHQRQHDEIYKIKIKELENRINRNENDYRLNIDESVYLVKTLYNIMKKNNILDSEMDEYIQEYLAKYK